MGASCTKAKQHNLAGSRRLTLTQQPRPVFDLPPNANISAEIDTGEHIVDYAAVSVPGTYYQFSFNPMKRNTRYKTNQDSFFAVHTFNDDKTKLAFGVMDGHGPNGHYVSRWVAERIPALMKEKADVLSKFPKRTLTEIFVQTDQELENIGVDLTLSGTTVTVAYIEGSNIYVANAGDSRCVLARMIAPEKMEAIDLSDDHKPDLPAEQARIQKAGGRVAPLASWPDGPRRVWLPTDDVPGLAMSRSMGDRLAHRVGVVAEPEIKSHKLDTEKDHYMILASDGVWEFIESQESVDMVSTMPVPVSGAEYLCKESVDRWAREEPVCDDITALVVFFNR